MKKPSGQLTILLILVLGLEFTGAHYRQKNLEAMLGADSSLTGAYLSGTAVIETPAERRGGNGRSLLIKNAYRNNLKHIDVEFRWAARLHYWRLVLAIHTNELLYSLQHHFTRKVPFPQQLDAIKGLNADKAIVIDQSPIGHPAPNPATYTYWRL